MLSCPFDLSLTRHASFPAGLAFGTVVPVPEVVAVTVVGEPIEGATTVRDLPVVRFLNYDEPREV
jgi:hypothetical protein